MTNDSCSPCRHYTVGKPIGILFIVPVISLLSTLGSFTKHFCVRRTSLQIPPKQLKTATQSKSKATQKLLTGYCFRILKGMTPIHYNKPSNIINFTWEARDHSGTTSNVLLAKLGIINSEVKTNQC